MKQRSVGNCPGFKRISNYQTTHSPFLNDRKAAFGKVQLSPKPWRTKTASLYRNSVLLKSFSLPRSGVSGKCTQISSCQLLERQSLADHEQGLSPCARLDHSMSLPQPSPEISTEIYRFYVDGVLGNGRPMTNTSFTIDNMVQGHPPRSSPK